MSDSADGSLRVARLATCKTLATTCQDLCTLNGGEDCVHDKPSGDLITTIRAAFLMFTSTHEMRDN